MSRLAFMAYFGEYRGGDASLEKLNDHHDDDHHHHTPEPHEVSPFMYGPLIVLGLLATFGGVINLPHWFPVHSMTGKLHHFLAPVFQNAPMRFDAADPSLEIPLMVGTVSLAFVAVGFAWFLYSKKYAAAEDKSVDPLQALLPRFLFLGSLQKWWIDEIYEASIIQPILNGSRTILHKIIDVEVIDGTVNGLGNGATFLSRAYGKNFQNGKVQMYALVLAAGAAVMVFAFAVGS